MAGGISQEAHCATGGTEVAFNFPFHAAFKVQLLKPEKDASTLTQLATVINLVYHVLQRGPPHRKTNKSTVAAPATTVAT